MSGTARAADGHELRVTRFAARGEPWASMVVAPAMGVRQDFYAPLARFMAGSGIHVLTFDYRGSGFSRRGPMRGIDARVTDWAEKDLDAMLLEARGAAPALPLAMLGHSLGGQLLGVLPHNGLVDAAINVTAGSGWYRFNERMRVQVRVFWFVAVPLLTPLFGYFPGRRLRMVGDLPAGVARQWRSWCLHPDYLVGREPHARAAFDRMRAPLLSWSFEDDAVITQAAVRSLDGFYRNARLEHRHVVPPPGQSIGHFGYFSERRRDTLWAESLSWLRGSLAGGGEGR